jgi:hypothetical protein
MSGSDGRGGRRYTGIADPRTARVLVDPARGKAKAPRVHDGFYSFALPPRSGRVQLREVTTTGETVRSFRLRR